MILIIQNGFLDTYIQKYLDDQSHVIRITSNLEIVDIDIYDLVIILGGHQSVSQMILYPELNKLVKFMKKCSDKKKPILGICLGCQVIAHIAGCKLYKNLYVYKGYDTMIHINDETYSNIFRHHSDYIVPNDKINVLSFFDDKPYVFTYENMIGVQCHPDIPPDKLANFIDISKIKKKLNMTDAYIDNENMRLITKLLEIARSL